MEGSVLEGISEQGELRLWKVNVGRWKAVFWREFLNRVN
jgi:hypothetical protein